VPEVGTDEYPEPIVDLKQTREAALAAYEHVKAARR
jgi:deoxyribodipyrimidine photo-lyase